MAHLAQVEVDVLWLQINLISIQRFNILPEKYVWINAIHKIV